MGTTREEPDFDQLHAEYTTYKSDASIVYDMLQPGGSVSVGLAVRLVDDATVGLTIDGSPVEGHLMLVQSDGLVNVQTDGFCELPGGVGAVGAPGAKIVGAVGGVGNNKPGYVRDCAAPGGAYSQAVMQEISNADGEIIDGSDLTHIVVDL